MVAGSWPLVAAAAVAMVCGRGGRFFCRQRCTRLRVLDVQNLFAAKGLALASSDAA